MNSQAESGYFRINLQHQELLNNQAKQRLDEPGMSPAEGLLTSLSHCGDAASWRSRLVSVSDAPESLKAAPERSMGVQSYVGPIKLPRHLPQNLVDAASHRPQRMILRHPLSGRNVTRTWATVYTHLLMRIDAGAPAILIRFRLSYFPQHNERCERKVNIPF